MRLFSHSQSRRPLVPHPTGILLPPAAHPFAGTDRPSFFFLLYFFLLAGRGGGYFDGDSSFVPSQFEDLLLDIRRGIASAFSSLSL